MLAAEIAFQTCGNKRGQGIALGLGAQGASLATGEYVWDYLKRTAEQVGDLAGKLAELPGAVLKAVETMARDLVKRLAKLLTDVGIRRFA